VEGSCGCFLSFSHSIGNSFLRCTIGTFLVTAETLSFGNSSGRGSFERKNVKRRKQEFHTRKIKLNPLENEKQDLDSLKNKVIVSLTHLGEQKFTTEPGGYSFENWMKSFNLLLDDFEQKAGSKNLPKSYFEKRRDLSASLFKTGTDLQDIEDQISKRQDEAQGIRRSLAMSAAKSKSESERKERDERIRELEEQSKETQRELDELKKRMATRQNDARASRGLFKRLVSGLSKPPDTTPLETLESRAEELRLKIQSNHRKISELKERNEKNQIDFADEGDSRTTKSPEEMESRLSEIESEIEKIESDRLERQQLADKRKEVTTTLSDEISKIKSPNSGEQNPVASSASPAS
jgi:hypothetical protein